MSALLEEAQRALLAYSLQIRTPGAFCASTRPADYRRKAYTVDLLRALASEIESESA